MKHLQLFILIIIGVVFTILGDMCFRQSGGIRNPRFLALGVVLYMAGAAPIPFIFMRKEFGVVFVMWEAATVLLAILIGYAVYSEGLTFSRVLAMVLALGALLLSCR